MSYEPRSEYVAPVTKLEKQRIYSKEAIRIGAYLGGPIVGAYLMSHNFKVFGNKEKARKAWLINFVVLVVLITLLWLCISKAPKGSSPPTFFPLLYSAAMFYIIKNFQGDEIDAHRNLGGETYGFWRVAIITTIGTAVTFVAPGLIFFV
jgi:hypothetical protein